MVLNCPIVDQRHEVGSDGRPPEDGNMDCVPASLASMARGLKPELTGMITADGLHDAAYGQGYVGMQNPADFVPLLAPYGLLITPYRGPASALIARAVREIQAGHPVLLSIPSDWGNTPPTSKYAHMVAGFKTTAAGSLTAMNPWTASNQTQTLAWWTDRLARCAYQGIWVMTLQEAHAMPIPTGWTDSANGDPDKDGTLTAPNKLPIVRGFRDHILRAASWNAALVPMSAEYGITNGSRQDFALRLEWSASDPTKVTETPHPLPAPAAPPPDLTAEKKAAALDAVFAIYKAIGSS